MGNCLKAVSTDDISLLRESPSNSSLSGSGPLHGHHNHHHQNQPSMHEHHIMSSDSHVVDLHAGHLMTGRINVGPHIGRSGITEEEQVRMAQRLGLIQHLPTGRYDEDSKKVRECVICMNDFVQNDPIRFLPCMHVYHTECIDDWLMRGSFTCPSCMEPVDAALLSTYHTN